MDSLRLTTTIIPIITTKYDKSSKKPNIWPLCYSIKHPFTSLIPGKCSKHDAMVVDAKDGQNGSWVFRVLQVSSLWKSDDNNHGIQDVNEQVYDQEKDDHEKVVMNQECEACRVDDDDVEDDKSEFDKNSFSNLLWNVSLGEMRLYAQMAYLGSLSYTIPNIKLGNLLKRHKFRFIISSLEKKAKKEMASDEVQQEVENVVVEDDLNSLYSSPCEWYICDDDESSTRYFVIQGSESLAAWQANLLFEPIHFEGMDVLVHRGIYEAAKVVYEEMLPYVHEHLKRHNNRATIRLTGHSLGGSLSLLVNLMLLIRGQVPLSCLLPVITYGAPWVMCGGDRLLHNLGLPRNHLQGIIMHRDIVPRAFSCNYPPRMGHFLKAINENFRNHPCLNNQNLLYAPMGEFLILQPNEKISPSHDLLPSGSGLYVLRSQASNADVAKKQTMVAQSTFLNTPHPLEILTDRCAYGPDGAILRDHDVDTYLVSIRNVISQELKRVRKMKRQYRRRFWWEMVVVNHNQVKLLFDGGRKWLKMVVATLHMNLVVMFMVPFASILVIEACNWIRRR